MASREEHIEPADAERVVAVAGLIHESNAFATAPTNLDAFVRLDRDQFRGVREDVGTEFGGALAEVRRLGARAVPTSLAWAQSSGPVDDDAANTLIDELVDGVVRVAASGRLDGLVVCLHGSMCSVADEDLDGAALARLRAALGDEVPTVATLDWHASVSSRMVSSADVLVGYRTYPHIDQEARGRDAAALVLRLADDPGPVYASWRHPPLLLAGPLTRHDSPAMADVLARAQQLGDDRRVVSWSVLPGFARSDNSSTGCHVYAVATDPVVADAVTAELSSMLWDRRDDFVAVTEPPTPAVLAAVGRGDGPVVLSDQGDNPGGGAAGDGTVLLGLLDEHGPPGSVVASLFDPEAVRRCTDAGIGATLDLELGGHTDDLHGPTVALVVTVECLADGEYVMRSPTHPNVPVRIGPVARVRTAGNTVIVLTSSRVQNEDLELLEHVGVDAARAPVIAVKSNAHFRAAFEPIASFVVDVDTPGLSTPHLERLPYEAVPRPIFPLDADVDWTCT